MALRIRRDVQKASYYVWFLGAEEAKGLRGTRVINAALPYLIDRARSQEPLKITLQVSHKGIKILQGSSKHFIPHSAITSSVQIDDIVACVLLLYNPATKCPLHVHAYRCDSEATAEALHQQLQTLINRAENQKRFQELESRLGIVPPMLAPPAHHHSKEMLKHKPQFELKQQEQRHHPQAMSPKRLGSSMGSDTGNSTRESEGSEEHSPHSPLSHSPLIAKTSLPPAQCNDLFDSLAAELRAKLNGNGPPLLLPPRDYDTVHRSKGNLTAIELRRCRNSLIVGGPNAPNAAGINAKQVSSRGSSGIGSDLAPSPERQDINSSSDEEHWSNEADNSVIALKPSQIACHPQLNRRNATKLSEDSYLRDLPVKPYVPREPPNNNSSSDRRMASVQERNAHAKLPPPSAWTREDEIKPVIVRPADYDAKLNRILQADHNRAFEAEKKTHDRAPPKAYAIDRRSPDRYNYKNQHFDEFAGQEAYNEAGAMPGRSHINTRKDMAMEKLSMDQYPAKMPADIHAGELMKGSADFPYNQSSIAAAAHNKYAAVHRGLGGAERQRDCQRESEERDELQRHVRDASRKRDHLPRTSSSHDRNPYRETECVPYIQSMEKMMKTCEIRYKSFENVNGPPPGRMPLKRDSHDPRLDQRNMESDRAAAASRTSNKSSKEHFNNPHDRFRYEGKEMQDFRDHRQQPRGRGHGDGGADLWSSDDQRQEQSLSSMPREQWEYSVWPKQNKCAGPTAREPMHSVEAHESRDAKFRRPPGNMRMERELDGDNAFYDPRYKRSESFPDPADDHYHQQNMEYQQRQRDGLRERNREHVGQRSFSPDMSAHHGGHGNRRMDFMQGKAHHKPSSHHSDKRPSGGFSPDDCAVPIANARSLSNLAKGYRNSYADPVLMRPGGRVGLAAVNPF